VAIWSASCVDELPVGTKPVAFGLGPEVTTVTMTAAIAATTASAAADSTMMSLRRFPGGFARRPLPVGPDGRQGPAGPFGS